MLKSPSRLRTGRRLLIFPLRIALCTFTRLSCDRSAVLVLPETDPRGADPREVSKAGLAHLEADGTAQLSRSSRLHNLSLLPGRDFLQSFYTLSVVLPQTTNTFSVYIHIKLLAFSVLSLQRRTSSHGHARKRAKVWDMLPSLSCSVHSEPSHDPSPKTVLSSLLCFRSQHTACLF